MIFHIITAFPDAFKSYFNISIIKKAIKKNLIKINIVDLRKFANDKHKTIDDKPYGGGPGMVLKFEPIYRAIKSLKLKKGFHKSRIILFSTKGKIFNNLKARCLSKYNDIVLICGHYEGVDERVKYIIDEEISIGQYILSGGEVPAMVLVDAISRQIPGVLGKLESLEEIKGSYPVYTRPEKIKIGQKILKVPRVLLSGDHKKIEEWRKAK